MGFFGSLEVNLTPDSFKNDSVQLSGKYSDYEALLITYSIAAWFVIHYCIIHVFFSSFFLKKGIYFKGTREVQSTWGSQQKVVVL